MRPLKWVAGLVRALVSSPTRRCPSCALGEMRLIAVDRTKDRAWASFRCPDCDHEVREEGYPGFADDDGGSL